MLWESDLIAVEDSQNTQRNAHGGAEDGMMTTKQEHLTVRVTGVPISTLNMEQTCRLVSSWAADKEKTRCVTFANAHMLAVASVDDSFFRAMNGMDLNCPDGRPLMWVGRYLEGHAELQNVPGPDFMSYFIECTKGKGLRHFFLGARPGVAESAVRNLRKLDPDIQVVGCYSPPYAPLSEEGLAKQAEITNESGADIVWLSLGCPKQELWLHFNRHRLDRKVVLAVGQAIDLAAGNMRRAPRVFRWLGLEWLYRLVQDPVRLSPRYFKYNSIFLWEVFKNHLLKEQPRTV